MPEHDSAGFERWYRVRTDSEERSEPAAPTPGKCTLVEQVYGHGAPWPRSSAIPGKRTLVEQRSGAPWLRSDQPVPGKRSLVEANTRLGGAHEPAGTPHAEVSPPHERGFGLFRRHPRFVRNNDAALEHESDVTTAQARRASHAKQRIAPTSIEGRAVQSVRGEGMSCLINAILTATGLHTDERVRAARQFLVAHGVAAQGEMLDLAGHVGQKLIAYLRSVNLIAADRGVVAWHYAGTTLTNQVVVPGADPIGVFLSTTERQFYAVMDS
jgi:hypothetical protein